jgi:hypothetical protein
MGKSYFRLIALHDKKIQAIEKHPFSLLTYW